MKNPHLMKILTGAILLALVLVLSMLPEPAARYAALFRPALIAVVVAAVFLNTPAAVLIGALAPLCLYFIYWDKPFVPEYLVTLLALVSTALVTGLCFRYLNAAFPAVLLGILAGCVVTALSRVVHNYVNDLPYTFGDCLDELFVSRYPALILSLAAVPLVFYLKRRKNEDRVK